MGQITLKGDYRTKGFINLFGWRIQLWKNTGSITRSFRVIDKVEFDQTVRVPGPLDITVSVRRDHSASENDYKIVVWAHADGQLGFAFYRFERPLPTSSYRFPVEFEWNGNAFTGWIDFTPVGGN